MEMTSEPGPQVLIGHGLGSPGITEASYRTAYRTSILKLGPLGRKDRLILKVLDEGPAQS